MPDFVLRQVRGNISIPEGIQQLILFDSMMLQDPFPSDMLRLFDAPDYAARFRTQLEIEIGTLENLGLGSKDREEVTSAILHEAPVQELHQLSLSKLILSVFLIHLIARRFWRARLPVVIDDLTDLLPQPLRETVVSYLTRHHQVSHLVIFGYPQSSLLGRPDYLLNFYDGRINIFRNRS